MFVDSLVLAVWQLGRLVRLEARGSATSWLLEGYTSAIFFLSMADTKESVDTFKKCYVKHAQHPTFSTGAIQVGKEDDKVVKFFAVSAQKDTTRLISRKSLKSFAAVDSKIITFPFPADFENVSNFAFDVNSGKLALARSIFPKDGKPDVFIEIWQDGVLVKSIKATGKHGPVY